MINKRKVDESYVSSFYNIAVYSHHFDGSIFLKIHRAFISFKNT